MSPDDTVEHAIKYPYGDIEPKTKFDLAALAVLADLCDRRGVGNELQNVDLDIQQEIVATLSEIIESAMSRNV